MEIAPCTHWIAGQVEQSPKCGSGKKNPCSSCELNPGHPARSYSLY